MASVMRFDEWQDSNGVPVASGAGGMFVGNNNIEYYSVVGSNFTTGSSTFTDITGYEVTITPSSVSSKILVMAYVRFVSLAGSDDQTIGTNIVRDSTEITASFTRPQLRDVGWVPISMWILDSPNTTSPVTYKCQGRQSGTGPTATWSDRHLIAIEVQ